MAVSSILVIYNNTSYTSPFSITMQVGSVIELSAIALLDNGNVSNDGVLWGYAGSVNGTVTIETGGSTIMPTATVTANQVGTQVLRCIAPPDYNVYFDVTINVTGSSSIIPVTGISVSPSSLTLNEGESYTATATVYPSNATDKSVVWSTTNADIAVVTQDGRITGVNSGNTTIYAFAGNHEFYDTIDVTVQKAPTVRSAIVWYNGHGYDDDFSITVNKGDVLSFGSDVVMSDGSYDDAGVYWFFTNQNGTLSFGTTTLTSTIINAVSTGTDTLVMVPRSDTTITIEIAITVKDTVTEIAGGFAAYICRTDNTTPVEYLPFICTAEGVWVEYLSDIYPYTLEIGAEPTFTVETASNASYGFALSGGYYVSQNTGISSSYALAKITVETPGGYNLYVDCLAQGESSYDYGILSMIGQTLSASTTDDGATGVSPVMYNFKGKASSSVQTVDYGVLAAGTHIFYAKYRKDGSVNTSPDTFSFMLRFEK